MPDNTKTYGIIGFMVVILLLGVGFLISNSQNSDTLNVETISNQCNINDRTSCEVIQGTFEVLDVFSHDENAFTQGLFYDEGFLYEGTGRNRVSSVRKVEIESGQVLNSILVDEAGSDLPDVPYFGEGITLWNFFEEDLILQITWLERTCFMYYKDTLQPFNLPNNYFKFETTDNEGWGIVVHPDTREVIISDGSSYLHFYEFVENFGIYSFQLKRRLEVINPVTNESRDMINELELIEIEGELLLFMNIWYSDDILAVDLDTGFIKRRYNFSEENLPFDILNRENVLNGIAWDANSTDVYITGKLWRNMMRVSLD
eukprot:maker-scaffold_47-snap-gene-0.47-mRNA-1 protein AED:0.00 eAED:0.00 QI:91/1/1/1/1/1/2/42/315